MSQSIDFAGILRTVRASKRVLLTTHMLPDGDAIGSLLALNSLVRRLGAETRLIISDPVPVYLQFLPGWQQIELPDAVENEQFDLMISIDSADLERLGKSGAVFLRHEQSIQMDHHQTNTRFAKYNLVMDDLPASGCLMGRLFREAALPYTRDEAIWLYTAISTDTGNFCFSELSAGTFELMADLMRAGLPIVDVARELHLMRERAHVLLLGRALNSLRFLADGRISAMRLTKQDFIDCGASGEHMDRIVNYGLYIPGVQLAYLASEAEEEGSKFSLRAIAPYEVADVAASLGGGGHAQAAGCTLDLPMDQAVAKVEEKLLEELHK